jgi:hypothetical protein
MPCYAARVKLVACAWRVFLLALAPIPKFQDGLQIVISFLILTGIVASPGPLSAYLPNDPFYRLGIVSAVILVSVFIAACRLDWRLSQKPLTIEFTDISKFGSRVWISDYKKTEDQTFLNFHLRVNLIFRFNNTSDRPGCVKAMRLLLMKRQTIDNSKIVSNSHGVALVPREPNPRTIVLSHEPLLVENVSGFYELPHNFEIDSEYGFLLLDKDRYFLRLTLQALGQADSITDIFLNWEAILIPPTDTYHPRNHIKNIKYD